MKKITETQLKLRSAGSQMKLASANSQNKDILESCVNSFVSLARSVTFVMQRESADNKQLLGWYNSKMMELKKKPCMKFFNDKRVYTIHKGHLEIQIKTAKVTDLQYGTGEFYPSGTVSVWLFYGVEEYLPGDSGNVFRLCEEYFLILKQLVFEWLHEKSRLEQASKLSR